MMTEHAKTTGFINILKAHASTRSAICGRSSGCATRCQLLLTAFRRSTRRSTLNLPLRRCQRHAQHDCQGRAAATPLIDAGFMRRSAIMWPYP